MSGFRLVAQDYCKWRPGDRRPDPIVEMFETRPRPSLGSSSFRTAA